MVGQHGTTELDHGLFQGPPLRLSVVVTYAIASLGFLIALALFMSQFSIPDVPALEDVEELRSFDDIQQLDSTRLKDAEGLEAERAGWGNAYAAEGRFAVMEATLTEGVLAVEECVYVEDEDGGHWSKRSSIRVEPSDGFTIRDRTGLERTVRYGFEDGTPTDLPVVLGFAERSCNGAWSERISGAEADSLVLLLLIEEDPERIQVLSIQEVGVMEAGNPPNSVAKEVTAREDRGRWALVGTGIAGFFVMVGTPTSLSTDLRRLRKARAKMAKTSGGGLQVSWGPRVVHSNISTEEVPNPVWRWVRPVLRRRIGSFPLLRSRTHTPISSLGIPGSNSFRSIRDGSAHRSLRPSRSTASEASSSRSRSFGSRRT